MAAGLSFKIGADTTALGRGLGRAEGMVGKFGNSIKRLSFAGLAAGTAAVAGLSVALKKSVEAAMGLENLEVAFTAITGSADQARQLLSEFREESMRTGIAVDTMAGMVRKLMANGMGMAEAQKMTSSLLDVAGTLGMSESEAGLLGTALAQVQAKGVASMEELRQQIAEKGVPIFEVLAQKIGVSTGELIKMVGEGKVGANVVMEAFSNLEGPLAKFRGGAEKMAQTTGGSFRRLKATMADVFADAGKPLLEGLSGVVNKITEKITEWRPMIKGWAADAGAFLAVISQAFSAGELGGMIKLSLIIAAKAMVSTLWSGMKAAVAGVVVFSIEGIKTAWSKVMDMSFWQGVFFMLKSGAQWLEVAALKIAAAAKPWQNFENAIETRSGIAKGLARTGMLQMGEAGDGRSVGDVLALAAEAAAEEYEDAMKKPLMGSAAEKKQLADLWLKMKQASEAAAAAREAEKKTIDEKPAPKKKLAEEAAGFIKPMITGLQRVGGGRVSGAVFSLDKERNGLLRSIDRKVGQSGQAVYA